MNNRILLGITGSIAAYKACDLIGLLKREGYEVTCVMTPDAERFITPLTVETLADNKAYVDMFELPEDRDPAHVSLADDADLVLIAPATADIIAKLAAGICDDMLTCTVCASRAPVVLVPAMNDGMFNNPIIQDKISYLSSKGYHFVGPVKGHLACGREGVGHIAPLEDILCKAKDILK